MLTMLKCIFDYSMFTSVLKLYINYIFIKASIEIINLKMKKCIKKLRIYKYRNYDEYKFSEVIEFLFLVACFSIVASLVILYCLFFTYECAFAIYNILIKYHIIRNI